MRPDRKRSAAASVDSKGPVLELLTRGGLGSIERKRGESDRQRRGQYADAGDDPTRRPRMVKLSMKVSQAEGTGVRGGWR